MNQLQRFYQWVLDTPPLLENKTPVDSLPNRVNLKPINIAAYSGNPRLGFLYQHLCTQYFVLNPKYSVELEEVQLNNSEKKTIGAIDLIIKDETNANYEHWEMAIKFYLLHNDVWYGPNAHDQLDKKLARMLTHQLKMSDQELFKQRHPRISPLSKHLLLQGRLYTNPFIDQTMPKECLGYRINLEQVAGYWCYQHQWHLISETLYELPKEYWATGLTTFDSPLSQVSGKFVHAQSEAGRFWFIVEDTWPN